MAVEMVKVRHPETGAEAELPATAVGRQQFEKWVPVDEKKTSPAKGARAASSQQEG